MKNASFFQRINCPKSFFILPFFGIALILFPFCFKESVPDYLIDIEINLTTDSHEFFINNTIEFSIDLLETEPVDTLAFGAIIDSGQKITEADLKAVRDSLISGSELKNKTDLTIRFEHPCKVFLVAVAHASENYALDTLRLDIVEDTSVNTAPDIKVKPVRHYASPVLPCSLRVSATDAEKWQKIRLSSPDSSDSIVFVNDSLAIWLPDEGDTAGSHDVIIRAKDNSRKPKSAYDTVSIMLMRDTVICTSPGNFRVIDLSEKHIEIAWDEDSLADGYTVYRSLTSDFDSVDTFSTDTAFFSDSTDTTYFYKVTSNNFYGPSEESDPVINIAKGPFLNLPDDTVIVAETEFSFTVTAHDPNGDHSTLLPGFIPDNASYSTETGEFQWTPERDQKGTTTIRFSATDGKNTTTDSTVVTVKATAAIESSSGNITICAGERASFSVKASGSGPLEYQWMKQDDTLPEATQCSLVVASAAVEDADVYHCIITNSTGTVSSTPCTLTVRTHSSAADGITAFEDSLTREDTVICKGSKITLHVSGGRLGTDARWKWYENECDGSSIGEGDSIEVSPETATSYFVRAEGICNTTECRSITVRVYTHSVAATEVSASATAICAEESATLYVNNGTLGSGAAWEWYSDSCTGAHVGTGDSITVNPTTTATYFVRAEGICNTTECDSITIELKTGSVTANSAYSSPTTTCPGDQVAVILDGGSLGTGAQWYWYKENLDGEPVGTGTSIQDTPNTTTKYIVRAEGDCNITGTKSTTVTVNEVPATPDSISLSTDTLCPGNSVTLKLHSPVYEQGIGIKWFKGTRDGTSAGAGLTIEVSPTVTTTYFIRAEAEGNCGVSEYDSIIVPVRIAPTSPDSITLTSDTICFGASTTLKVHGPVGYGPTLTWEWFSGTCDGTVLGTDSVIAVSPSATTTYFVRAVDRCGTVSGCISATIVVIPLPVTPESISPTAPSVCSGTEVTLEVFGPINAGFREHWMWYTDTNSLAVDSGKQMKRPVSSTTTFFVRNEGVCEKSEFISAKVIAGKSSVPSGISTSIGTEGSCKYIDLKVSGGSLGPDAFWHWYKNSISNGTQIGTGSSIRVFSSGKYYIRAEGGPCGTTSSKNKTISISQSPYCTQTTSLLQSKEVISKSYLIDDF